MTSHWARAAGLASLSIVLAPSPSLTQPTVEAAIGSSLQSLAVSGASPGEARATVSGSGTAALEYGGGRGFAGYTLDGGTWASPGDWSFLQHRIEGRHRFDVASEALRVHLGVRGTLRRNGEMWADADYGAIGAFLNLESRSISGTTLRTGYRLDRRVFGAMKALDQTEHDAFASALLNFPTRTTVIAEAHVGWKSYGGDPALLDLPDGGYAADPAYGGRGSAGRGRGAGSGDMGPTLRPATPTLLPQQGENARQITVLARLAQSIGARTGVSVQGTWRTTAGAVPPGVVSTPAGFFDDGVYDDPFASGLRAALLRLKHVRPGGAVFEGTARRFRQSFDAARALDADGGLRAGDPLRADDVWRFDARASTPLVPSRTGAVQLELELGYVFTRSRSNDAFYAYTSHGGGLLLALRY